MIELGHTVGNYKVTAKLGEGGMGVVYLAEHPVIGRKAALKAIHPQFARSEEIVSRFITEAKSIHQIGHRHIVDITDLGKTDSGDLYFIMEYLQGKSLGEAIEQDLRFQPERALRVAAQIADALQASHDHGVVHRDLKPDNIFLTTHGEETDFVKVLDFGLAKLVGNDATPSHKSRTGSVMGTPYYMAPEQCEGRIEVDHRADVYSLGVILFEMLTGKLPFGGTGYGEVLLKHMVARAPAARSIVPELPEALETILSRALAKDRELRFQSMTELRDALLDPVGYASSVPAHPIDDDHSGRIREAEPMTRVEMAQLPTRITAQEGPVRARAASTLSEGAVELGEDAGVDRIPRTHYGRGLMLTAMAAAAFVLLAKTGYRRPVATAVAAAQALSWPAALRVSPVVAPAPATIALPVAAAPADPVAAPADDPTPAAATAPVIVADASVVKTVSHTPKPRRAHRARAARRVERPAYDRAIDTDETLAPTFDSSTAALP